MEIFPKAMQIEMDKVIEKNKKEQGKDV
jgi:hypothetical protein